jgi:PTS system mannose-specific IIC component
VTAVDAGEVARAARQNLRAMWPQFFFYGLACVAGALAGRLLAPWEHALPDRLLRGLAWAYPAMGTAAAAMAVHGSHARRRFLAAGVGAGAVALIALGVWVTT